MKPPIVAVRLVDGCIRSSHPFGRVSRSMSISLRPAPTRIIPGRCHSIASSAVMSSITPAMQRHRLAVIAGAAATRGDRDLVPEAGGGDAHHIGFVARADHRVRLQSMQLPVQHGAIPEEIARFLPHQRGFGGVRDISQIASRRFQFVHAILLGSCPEIRR